MPDTPTQPVSWRCLNCQERVDPTMDLCWNCGHDREGVAQPALFVDKAPSDITICAQCRYDLKGNPDATDCPKCGDTVPWADCPACGVRASRWLIAEGCPACLAAAAGVTFIPEVEMKSLTHCPRCRYDLRGLPEGNDCPECGWQIAEGAYDTLTMEGESSPVSIESLRRRRWYWLLLIFLLLPGMLVVFLTNKFFVDHGYEELGTILVLFWVVGLFVCIIQLVLSSQPKRDRDDVGNPSRKKTR